MDALISELKNGRVTLRRRQAPRDTENAALRELFEVLQHSQEQNRSSKSFLINHKYNVAEAEENELFWWMDGGWMVVSVVRPPTQLIK